jgi:PEP-CTERM motif-containing protein
MKPSRFGWTTTFLLALSAISASGTALPACTVAGDSISFALSSTPGNSYACGDKVFSGFTNPNGISGTVSLTELNTDQYKLSFVAAGGGIATSFSFGFTVAIASGFPTWNISQIQASMLTGMAVGGGASIPNASTGTLSLSSGVFSPVVVDALSSQGQNSVASVFATTETVGFAYNPTGSAGVGAGKFVSIDYVINQTQVPEPATWSLIGASLLALGFVRRRIQT